MRRQEACCRLAIGPCRRAQLEALCRPRIVAHGSRLLEAMTRPPLSVNIIIMLGEAVCALRDPKAAASTLFGVDWHEHRRAPVDGKPVLALASIRAS